MSDAVLVTVAKAVTSRIAAAVAEGEFGTAVFTPERTYADWDLELTNIDALDLRDSDKLHVDVVSHTTQQATQLSSRGTIQYTVPVDIAVRRKFGTDKTSDDTGRVAVEEIDKLMLLVQQLHVLFTAQRLVQDFEHAVWDNAAGGTNIVAAPVRQHLRELRQFTGIIRIFFRVDVKL